MMSGLPGSARTWIRLVTILVVVSVCLSLAHLTWRLVGWDDGRARIETSPNLTVPGNGASGLASILALAPFGGKGGSQGLPVSNLGLVLKAVIYSADPAASSALIASADGIGQTYGVGQTPVGNAVIEAIEMDRVILNLGGRRELLVFAPLSTDAGAGAGAMAISGASSSQTGAASASSQPVSPLGTALSGAATASTSAAETSPPGAQAQGADPQALLSGAGLASTGEGYRVGPSPPAQLRRAGLRPGDLIRSLNGQTVSDLASDQQLVERAVAAGSARVEIVRDGRTLTLTIPLR